MRGFRLALLFCLGGPATASAAGYHVDLIVVLNRQATPEIAAAARSAGVHGPRAVDRTDKVGLQRAGITLLGADGFGLDEQWKKLRSSRFKPVLGWAWLQAPKPTATALRVRDDFRYRIVATPMIPGETIAVSPATPPLERYRLDGSFLLQQSAGLRVAFNMNYSFPSTAAPAEYPKSSGAPVPVASAELITVTLHGEKRINLNQNYFFDHPVLGVLLRVSQGGAG